MMAPEFGNFSSGFGNFTVGPNTGRVVYGSNAIPLTGAMNPVSSYSSQPVIGTGGIPGGNINLGNVSGDIINESDPWRSQRSQYQVALSDLIKNPTSFTNSPLFKASNEAGIEAVNRSASAKGLLGSGNRLQALMDYGQKNAPQQFFQMTDLLSQLAGAKNQNPGGGFTSLAQLSGAQTAAQNAATNQYQAETQRQAATNNAEQARQNAQQQATQLNNTWRAQQDTNDYNRQLQQYQDQQRQQQLMQQSLQDFMNQGRDIALNYR